MDNLPERPDSHHHICIDAEGEVEPNSPKTITESSSEFSIAMQHLTVNIISLSLSLSLLSLSLFFDHHFSSSLLIMFLLSSNVNIFEI